LNRPFPFALRCLAVSSAVSGKFKCNDCSKNTAIKNIYSSCGDRQKIRKNGLQFFTECEKCGISQLFHTNSPASN
jgi:hypothetical protein